MDSLARRLLRAHWADGATEGESPVAKSERTSNNPELRQRGPCWDPIRSNFHSILLFYAAPSLQFWGQNASNCPDMSPSPIQIKTNRASCRLWVVERRVERRHLAYKMDCPHLPKTSLFHYHRAYRIVGLIPIPCRPRQS